MKITKTIITGALLTVLALMGVSCSKTQSYAELLRNEEHATNWYLSQQRVEMNVPSDSVFEYGENAPYYRIDPDGYVYMQVINPGSINDKSMRANKNELVYFRYTRWNLQTMYETGSASPQGNAVDMSLASTYFRYGDLSVQSSYKHGAGIQMPLSYLPIDCEVNLVMRSYYGFMSENASVIPYLMNVKYYRAAMQ